MARNRIALLWTSAVLLTLAWGAGAFGANYPWAYTPLLIASSILGVAGLFFWSRADATLTRGAVGLLIIATPILIQLLPLPRDAVRAVSPQAEPLITQYDLGAALLPPSYLALSIAPQRTWLGLAFVVGFGLLLVGAVAILSRRDARMLAIGITLLATVMAFVGIVQKAMWNGKIYGFWQPIMIGDPFGPFVNKNHFAGWMLMAIPVAVGLLCATVVRSAKDIKLGFRDRVLWLSSPDATQALLIGFAVFAMVLSLLLTMSRSGIVALAVTFIIAGAVLGYGEKSVLRKAALPLFVGCVMLGSVLWVGFDAIAARFGEKSSLDASGRFAIWSDTVSIIRDFWLTGTGFNTYDVATLFYQKSLPDQHLREAHNEYLQLAAEGGVLVMVPVAVAVWGFVGLVQRRFERDAGSARWIRAGAVTGISAIAIQSLGEFSLQMPGNAALFTVLCGLALHDAST